MKKWHGSVLKSMNRMQQLELIMVLFLDYKIVLRKVTIVN